MQLVFSLTLREPEIVNAFYQAASFWSNSIFSCVCHSRSSPRVQTSSASKYNQVQVKLIQETDTAGEVVRKNSRDYRNTSSDEIP